MYSTLEGFLIEFDLMLSQDILQEVAGEALDANAGDILGIPQEILRDVLVLDVEVDLDMLRGTSTNTKF